MLCQGFNQYLKPYLFLIKSSENSSNRRENLSRAFLKVKNKKKKTMIQESFQVLRSIIIAMKILEDIKDKDMSLS